MKNISYASVVKSLMYVKVCTIFDIAFSVEILERYKIIQVLIIRKLRKK